MRNMRDMPILVLSSQSDYESKERAYQMGADDFMEKPLVPRECLFRVQALMRRYNAPPSEQRYTIVNFEICGSTTPPPHNPVCLLQRTGN